MRAEDDTNDDSDSSDSLLREVARIDDTGADDVPVHRTPGSRIGRFLLRDELGRGGMGVVYRAFDDTLNRSVALKVLPVLGGAKAQEAKARLLREARAAASLEHPNVVAIYDVGEHEGAAFIAMELVVGQSLRERMREPSSLEEKVGWLSEIAAALSAAHEKGIVHRDVKPENVMIKRDGHVKVLDFGIARQAASPVDPSAPTEDADDRLATLTAEGVLVGTPRYMAPEQLLGEKLDGRCDQFAWGLVAYELFAGGPPWDTDSGVALVASILNKEPPPLGEAAPDVPKAIVAAVERALSKSARDRFATMLEVVEALDAGRSSQRMSRPPAAHSNVGWRIGAAVLVASVAAIAGVALSQRTSVAPTQLAAPSASASASASVSTSAPPTAAAVTVSPGASAALPASAAATVGAPGASASSSAPRATPSPKSSRPASSAKRKTGALDEPE